MIQYVGPALWIGLSVVVGVLACKRNRSFGAWFLLALMLSPLLAIILLLNFPPAIPRQPDIATSASWADRSAGRYPKPHYPPAPGPQRPSKLLIALAVLALAVLAPAVWSVTTLHAYGGPQPASVSKSLSALAGRLPSGPSEPATTAEEPASTVEFLDEVVELPTPTPTPAHRTGFVSAPANVRAGPGTHYFVTGSLDTGTAVRISDQTSGGDWYQLANGGWIAAFLVSLDRDAVNAASTAASSMPSTVNVDVANLRSGPGAEYPVVGNLLAGQEVEIVGTSAAGDWYQLADGNWIFAELVGNATR